MTTTKTLARGIDRHGRTVEVLESIDKFSSVPRYEIVTSKDGIAVNVDRTARTTWKKAFSAIITQKVMNAKRCGAFWVTEERNRLYWDDDARKEI